MSQYRVPLQDSRMFFNLIDRDIRCREPMSFEEELFFEPEEPPEEHIQIDMSKNRDGTYVLNRIFKVA